MRKNAISIREVASGIIGALTMLALMILAQVLDSRSMKKELDVLRAQSVSAGFEEGMNRIKCTGGARYDSSTGLPIDLVAR